MQKSAFLLSAVASLFLTIDGFSAMKAPGSVMNIPRYLVEGDFFSDPAAHVFEGKIYIYPSHDRDSGKANDTDGAHYDMWDYHVFSLEDVESGKVTDYGVVLSGEDVPWATKQLWDCDVAEKDGKYYMYFPARDKNNMFRIGVATSDRPYGPFAAQPTPMMGSYSIDPSVFRDADGSYYIYFGGIRGGQLHWYEDNKALECSKYPDDDQPAIPPRVAKLTEDMLEFAEDPRPVMLLDKDGTPLLAGDQERRFFEAAWIHVYDGRYYLSYSTGNTHKICYATGDNPYGPFTYQGVILTPVVGWTTHHAIVEYKGKWYLFHHDSVPSGGRSYLRSMKVVELEYNEDGTIKTVMGQGER